MLDQDEGEREEPEGAVTLTGMFFKAPPSLSLSAGQWGSVSAAFTALSSDSVELCAEFPASVDTRDSRPRP